MDPVEVTRMHAKYPFFEAIGCLWWAATISRADIAPATHAVSCSVSRPTEKLWIQILRIFQYLKKHPDIGLVFTRPKPDAPLLRAAADASLADARKGRSTIGHCTFFMGCLVDWRSCTSTRVADSSAEAEAMALAVWGKENAWYRGLLRELCMIDQLDPTKCRRPVHILEDNSAVISMSNGPQSKQSRHYDLTWYKFKDCIAALEYVLEKVDTHQNPADLLRKLCRPRSSPTSVI